MAHAISLTPLVTEKALRLAGEGKYTFVVNRSATKLGIQRAIRADYRVTVTAVNITKVSAKVKQRGLRPGFSKAVVTLKKGDTIQGFELPMATTDQPSPQATDGKLSEKVDKV